MSAATSTPRLRRLRGPFAVLFLALALLLVAGGCKSPAKKTAAGSGSGSGSAEPTVGGGAASVCTKSFARCKLPGGPLGVCMAKPCPAGKKGRCFRCQSQH